MLRSRTLAVADGDAALSRLQTTLGRVSTLDVVGGVARPSDLAHAVRRMRPDLVYVQDTVTGGRWAQAVDALPADVRVVAVGLGRTDDPAAGLARGGGARYPTRLAVPTRGHIEIVRVGDIDYVEGAGSYTRVRVGGRVLLLKEGLGDVARRLDPRRFVRIHRSVVVNAERVRALRPVGRGEYAVDLADGTEFKLTRTYRDRLGTLLGTA